MSLLPNPLPIDSLLFIVLLSIPVISWGFRHGLDAVIILVLGVLAAMAIADTLAGGVVGAVNTIFNLINAILTAGFGSPEFFSTFQAGPGLFQSEEQIHLLGTIIFLMIFWAASRIAVRQAGGTESFFESAFGGLGGAVTGYLVISFVIARHVQLPQQVIVNPPSDSLPDITLDAGVVVLIALVVIVFGVTSSRRG